jgi:hypothetical protein
LLYSEWSRLYSAPACWLLMIHVLWLKFAPMSIALYILFFQTLYDEAFISLYNVCYTSLPTLAMGIFDQVQYCFKIPIVDITFIVIIIYLMLCAMNNFLAVTVFECLL